MVVEHSFITTLEAADAMRLASQILTARGFQAEASTAFALDGSGWNTLEVARGRKNAARAKSALDLPQRVRLEWDRGRVTMAASSLSASTAGSVGSFQLVERRNKKREQDQTRLLTAIARAMELALAAGRPEQATAEWDQIEQSITARVSAARRRTRNVLIGFAVFAALVIAAAVFAAWYQNQ